MTNKKRRHKLAKEIRKATGLKLPEAGMVARKIVKGDYCFDDKFPFVSYEGGETILIKSASSTQLVEGKLEKLLNASFPSLMRAKGSIIGSNPIRGSNYK